MIFAVVFQWVENTSLFGGLWMGSIIVVSLLEVVLIRIRSQPLSEDEISQNLTEINEELPAGVHFVDRGESTMGVFVVEISPAVYHGPLIDGYLMPRDTAIGQRTLCEKKSLALDGIVDDHEYHTITTTLNQVPPLNISQPRLLGVVFGLFFALCAPGWAGSIVLLLAYSKDAVIVALGVFGLLVWNCVAVFVTVKVVWMMYGSAVLDHRQVVQEAAEQLQARNVTVQILSSADEACFRSKKQLPPESTVTAFTMADNGSALLGALPPVFLKFHVPLGDGGEQDLL